jgi:hypothetical protein
MVAEEFDSGRFRGFRVNLPGLMALSGTTNEVRQRADMGNGRIAALARQYNNVVVIIRMARSIRTGLRFPPDISADTPADTPLWGRALGVRISRLASLRRALTRKTSRRLDGRFYAGRAELG